ncbi:hypothetical protein M0804_011912 [Polistes exclamans]|nr:hypothetical protein M0804_011912 [Polistes exclamans]
MSKKAKSIEGNEVRGAFPEVGISTATDLITVRQLHAVTDECADEFSDNPIDCADSESSDNSTIFIRKQLRTQRLITDLDESDEEDYVLWSDFDVRRTNNEFEGSPGPNVFPEDIKSVKDIVELFIGNDLFESISNETNKYYIQNCDRRKVDKKNVKFVNVTAVELKKWFGLVILMGIVKKAKIDDYWSTNPLLETPIFRKTMSRNRFRQILSFIHFSDNDNKPDNADRLFKVQPL